MTKALELIANERQRQIEKEGYTADRDDVHVNGELAMAAASYAIPNILKSTVICGIVRLWPWLNEYWKPTPNNRIRELEKAGALIVAEIERLQRKEGKE